MVLNDSNKAEEEKAPKKGVLDFLKENPLMIMMIALMTLVLLIGAAVVAHKMSGSKTTPIASIELDDHKVAKEKPTIREYQEEIKKEEDGIVEKDVTHEEVISINWNDQIKKKKLEEEEKAKLQKQKEERERLDKESLLELQKKKETSVQPKKVYSKPKTKIVYVEKKEKKGSDEEEYYEYDAIEEVKEEDEAPTKAALKNTKVKYYNAVIYGDYNAKENSSIKIRLTEDASIDGLKFKRNTIGYATVHFIKNRVLLTVSQLGDYKVEKDLYDDKDKAIGLDYIISEELLQSGQETRDRTVSRSTTTVPTSTNTGTLVGTGINLIKDGAQAVNRNVRKKEATANLVDQYKILIKE